MSGRGRSKASEHRRCRGRLSIGVLAVVGAVSLLVAMAVVVAIFGVGPGGSTPVADHTIHRVAPPPAATSSTVPCSHLRLCSPPRLAAGPASSVHAPWAGVLQRIDDRRGMAWRLGRPDLLARAFSRGSAALRADRTLLRSYVRRGFSVAGVSLRFGSVDVLGQRPNSARLLVVDRLGASFAVGLEGDRERLPRDRPTRHRIELRRVGHTWRIARVAVV